MMVDTGERDAKKQKMYFTPKLDITLLKVVIEINPFENTWEEVISAADFEVSVRTARERVTRLLRLYRADKTASLKKSGTDEEYEEREQLLQQVAEMETAATKEAKDAQVSARVKREKERKAAESVRKAAMMSRKRDSGDEGEEEAPKAKSKRTTSFGVLEFMKQKNEAEMTLRREELAFRHEQLRHDRERLEAEKEEKAAFLQLIMKALSK